MGNLNTPESFLILFKKMKNVLFSLDKIKLNSYMDKQ